MSLSTDRWLQWEYRAETANCWHFAREVWRELTGVMLPHHPATSISQMLGSAEEQVRMLRQLDAPVSPCLVLMIRKRLEPHVGVYVDRRVLHCTRFGASFQALDHVTVGYPAVTFYTNAP